MPWMSPAKVSLSPCRMMVVGGGEGTVAPSCRCRSARNSPRRWRRPADSMVRPAGGAREVCKQGYLCRWEQMDRLEVSA